MSEENPYSAPQAEAAPIISGNERLQGLDFKELKKLYYRSCNVNAITGLLILGELFLVIAMFVPDLGAGGRGILGAFAAFYLIAVIGLFSRSSWGRVMGIVVCILSLISFPLGTLIGIFGLFAFFGAPQLFGNDRITHKEVKAEFKLQKRGH